MRFFLTIIFALLALAPARAATRNYELYEKPRPVAAENALHLFLQGLNDPKFPCEWLKQVKPGEWATVSEFPAEFSTAIFADGKLLLFVPDKILQFDPATGKKTGEIRWPFIWRAQSAEVIGSTLAAFGVGADGSLYAAAIKLNDDVDMNIRLFPKPAEPAEKTSSSHDEMEKASPVANGAPEETSFIYDTKWTEGPVVSEWKGTALKVKAIVAGGKLWLFWTTKEQEGESLWTGFFSEGKVGHTSIIATFENTINFAPAVADGIPWIVFAPGSEADNIPIIYHRSFVDGTWQPFVKQMKVTSPVERIMDITAASPAGVATIFIQTNIRILQTSFNKGKWELPPKNINTPPMVQWMFDNHRTVIGIFVFLFVVTAGFIIRAAFGRRKIAVIDGIEYTFAPWWRRMGAFVFDLTFVFALISILLQLGQMPAHAALVMLFIVDLVYLGSGEARSGRTIGKSLFGIVVITRNGGYPLYSEAFLRNLTRAAADCSLLVPLALTLPLPLIAIASWFVALILILNTRGGQRIGDMMAGTYVVRERK